MSVHENVKYPCNQCEYKATHRGNLKIHKMSVHENIKYLCNLCNQCNHPPAIKKGLVQMIGYRISDLSSNEEIFNSVAPIYNQGLRNSGFTEEIKYEPNRPRNPRRRRRKVIYFNSPWDDQIKTNLGACFLRLVDKHFRPGTYIHSIFNRQKVKVSYSNMPNIKRIISGHNNKIVSPQSELTLKGCNCN